MGKVTGNPPRGSDERFEGRLVDLNTGALRHNHVLVQSGHGVELFIGLGPLAGRALGFAFDREFEPNSFLAHCDVVDQALERGDFAKAERLGAIGPQFANVPEPHLRRLALLEVMLERASVDDPVHPGYPKGDPQGRGGQYRPKDATDEAKDTSEDDEDSSEDESDEAKETTEQELKRLNARREFRIAASAALQLMVTAALNAVPGVGEVADVAELAALGRTAIELGNAESQVNAAIDFVKKGPYCLDDLQEKSNEAFSSFDAFKKMSIALEALLKRFGAAGPGNEYHHIVEQGGDNDTNIPGEELHSPNNIVKLPKLLHELVSAAYSKTSGEDKTKTVREWLQTQPFDVQRKYGIDTLQKLGVVRSDC